MISLRKKSWILFPIFVIIIFITIPIANSLKDPSTVYCQALGYTFKLEQLPEGELGVCQFPDGSTADSWQFLEGKIYQENSYCKKNGYDIKTIQDADKCSSIFNTECAVCILGNRTEIEVTKLMGLDFNEGVCGDGHCTLGENYANCPQDCPSGSSDFYCDGVRDYKCDPDCVTQNTSEKDPDCIVETTTLPTTTTLPVKNPFSSIYIYLIIILIVIAVIAVFFVRKIKIVR